MGQSGVNHIGWGHNRDSGIAVNQASITGVLREVLHSYAVGHILPVVSRHRGGKIDYAETGAMVNSLLQIVGLHVEPRLQVIDTPERRHGLDAGRTVKLALKSVAQQSRIALHLFAMVAVFYGVSESGSDYTCRDSHNSDTEQPDNACYDTPYNRDGWGIGKLSRVAYILGKSPHY